MNYWDLFPDDIRFKIVFDVLWTDSKELYNENLIKDKEELYDTLNNIFHRYYDDEKKERYYKLFINNGINSKEKLKQITKNDLSNLGVKWGSIIKIDNHLNPV